MANMVWTNEDTFKFIKLYQSKPIIWNPRNKKHTDRHLVDQAWNRIADAMDIPVSVLKRKKKTLMTTFRFHYKKKQYSLRRYKMGSKHIYTPIWTFYEPLEAFLKGVYESKSGRKIKVKKNKSRSRREADDTSEEKQNEGSHNEGIENEESLDEKPLKDLKINKFNIPNLEQRTNCSLGIKEASREVTSAFHLLNRIFKEKQKNNEQKNQDECELYGKLLAKKLRQFSETDRLDIMYELDGLLMNRCLRQSSESPPLQVIMKESISPSDSYASPSLSPSQTTQETSGNSKAPINQSPESPQSDPIKII